MSGIHNQTISNRSFCALTKANGIFESLESARINIQLGKTHGIYRNRAALEIPQRLKETILNFHFAVFNSNGKRIFAPVAGRQLPLNRHRLDYDFAFAFGIDKNSRLICGYFDNFVTVTGSV
jgi:hypothetical protein